jgi:hypothetical protein
LTLLAPLLVVSLLAATDPPLQLLISDSPAPSHCRDAFANSESAGTVRQALAADAAEDLRRYFRGFSVQTTPILNAAWHGRVHFCTEQAAEHVAAVLSQLVVKSGDRTSSGGGSLLPAGAESLLTALASNVLAGALQGVSTSNGYEEERKKQALAVVRAKIAHEDVVVGLDTDLADKVAVHFIHHAAVYYMLRKDSEFAARLTCVRESLATGAVVKFTYAVAGQAITWLECSPHQGHRQQ